MGYFKNEIINQIFGGLYASYSANDIIWGFSDPY